MILLCYPKRKRKKEEEKMAGNRQPLLYSVNISTFFLATVCVWSRLVFRIRRKAFFVSDWFLAIAWVVHSQIFCLKSDTNSYSFLVFYTLFLNSLPRQSLVTANMSLTYLKDQGIPIRLYWYVIGPCLTIQF